jgi:hypothetical protein
MVPGTMRQQDSRTRERICAALRTPGNSYSRVFEALGSLLHMEAEITGEGVVAVEANQEESGESEVPHQASTQVVTTRTRMEAWWKYNLQTECFSHKAIARHVRRCGL